MEHSLWHLLVFFRQSTETGRLIMFRSPFSSTIRVRDGINGSRRYSLMIPIVYTQKHNTYNLSRVRGRDDRLTERGTYKVTYRGI